MTSFFPSKPNIVVFYTFGKYNSFSFHLVEIAGQARNDGEMLNQVQHDGQARNDGWMPDRVRHDEMLRIPGQARYDVVQHDEYLMNQFFALVDVRVWEKPPPVLP